MITKLGSYFLIGRGYLIFGIAKRGNCDQVDSARMCSMHVHMGAPYTADGQNQVVQQSEAALAPCCLINTNYHKAHGRGSPHPQLTSCQMHAASDKTLWPHLEYGYKYTLYILCCQNIKHVEALFNKQQVAGKVIVLLFLNKLKCGQVVKNVIIVLVHWMALHTFPPRSFG